MSRVHQRYAEHRGEARADIAGIGVMTVQDIRLPLLVLEVLQGVVGKAVEVIPELFLADVAVRAGINPNDAGAVAQRLGLPGVIGADLTVNHPPGEQVNTLHPGLLCQCASQFDHVENLAAGIRIAAEFQIACPDQAVHADQHHIKSLVAGCVVSHGR